MTQPSRSASATGPSALRVLHFVTGGFSGATQVAVDLAAAGAQEEGMQTLLVLRRKRSTDETRVQALRQRGLQVEVLPGWSHLATIWALWRLCRVWRPGLLVAHGFPEHLLGRWAGLLARVPLLVQVEHNSRERYSLWRLWQARWLSRHSARLIGVSEGVRKQLLRLGMPVDKTVAIPNGVDLAPFTTADQRGWEQRQPGIVMSARFARQKDHLTLLRALQLLKSRGLAPPLLLAGSGKPGYRRQAEAEARRLGLLDQVQFLGHHSGMPELLMSQRICVLATHYEGMPLALVEGMAAGCACIASDVAGVSEVIDQGRTGLLVPEGDANALADALQRVLEDPDFGERLGHEARARALSEHGVDLMRSRYAALFRNLATDISV